MDVKELLAEQMRLFEEFKSANDQAKKDIERLGAADTLLVEKIEALNTALAKVGDDLAEEKRQLIELETRMNRPGGAGLVDLATERKALAAFQLEVGLHYQTRGRPSPVQAMTVEDYREYKRLFVQMVRYGTETWADAEKRAMAVGSDADGGFFVPSEMTGRMITRIFETSQIRQIASVQVIGRDALEGINDLNEANAGWVGEQSSRPATSTPQIGQWRIPAEEQYAMPEATQSLLDDAAVDVEAWLQMKVADKFARLEETAFVTGNGVAKPRGFASYTTAATADGTRTWGTLEHLGTGANGSFGTDPNGADKLIDLVHKLKAAYRGNARFVLNKTTLGAARKLKDGNGQYVWAPAMSIQDQNPSTLLGYPVSEAEDMATYTTTSALAVAFGDFREGYQIVDRIGIRVLRDPYTNKPYVRFYTTRRVGGGVLNFDAIKFLSFA